MSFVSFLICVSALTPNKSFYNYDRLLSLFKTKYVKSSEIRSIDKEIPLKYQDKDENGKPVVNTRYACEVTTETGSIWVILQDCDEVMNELNK